MADAVNPGTPVTPMAESSGETVEQRPALVTFAAIMMFLVGGFQLTWAFVEFANAAWLSANIYGSFGGYLWLWGILDALFAAVAFYAGYDLLRGGNFGRVFGVFFAAFNAIRWFFYLPAAPWVAIVIIALDVLIIYALVSHSEFFA